MEFPRYMFVAVFLLKLAEFILIGSALFVSEEISLAVPHILVLQTLLLMPFFDVIVILVTKYNCFRVQRYLVSLQVLHVILSAIWLPFGVFVCVNYVLQVASPSTCEWTLLAILAAVMILIGIETILYAWVVYKRLTFKVDSIPRLSDIDLKHPIEILSVSRLNLTGEQSQPSVLRATPKRRQLLTASDLSMVGGGSAPGLKMREEPHRTSYDSSIRSFREHHPFIDDLAPHYSPLPIKPVKSEPLFAMTVTDICQLTITSTNFVNDVMSNAQQIVEQKRKLVKQS